MVSLLDFFSFNASPAYIKKIRLLDDESKYLCTQKSICVIL